MTEPAGRSPRSGLLETPDIAGHARLMPRGRVRMHDSTPGGPVQNGVEFPKRGFRFGTGVHGEEVPRPGSDLGADRAVAQPLFLRLAESFPRALVIRHLGVLAFSVEWIRRNFNNMLSRLHAQGDASVPRCEEALPPEADSCQS